MLFGQFTKRQKQNGIPTVQETEQTGIVTKMQGINQIIKKLTYRFVVDEFESLSDSFSRHVDFIFSCSSYNHQRHSRIHLIIS